jgi:hypothetical protein
MEALFITGHSQGGAMASLAAALLFMDSVEEPETTARIRQVLRGVYTYGQPMVGNAKFACLCAGFDSRIFRHVYANDIVPHLPSKDMGDFRHFGREYRWQNKTNRWEPSPSDSTQAKSILWSNLSGVLDWVKQQFVIFRKQQFVISRRLHLFFRKPLLALRYSWEAHSPVHYMNAARSQSPASAGAPWV